MHVLEIDNLSKVYKNGRGVKNVSFVMDKGDVIGLLGPNGSGKTTIMKVVTGMIHATEGSVMIFGNDIEGEVEEALAKVGVLIERPAIYEYLSAYENLKMMAKFYDDITEEDIQHVMEVVRISKYQKEKPSRFSLGMKQRLGIAIALLSKPELVILDEPTNGLDIEGTVEIREIIKKMAKERGTSFLVASHLAAEIEKTCNKVAVISDGEMIAFDTMEEALRINPTLEDYFLSKVKEKRGSVII